jgi:predicted nucleotide-binding protein (sugar kinase/HSP70/actin superfamily)
MKITFPYMGPILVYKKLLEAMGHEVILPQKPTQRTFDLGTKYSPEFLCFPFKCLIGTYIESLERGADTVVTTGGDSSCRAGFYGEVHRRILRSIGYDVKFYVFDSLFQHTRQFLSDFRKLKAGHSWWHVLQTIRFCYSLIAAMDEIQERVRILRAHEKHKGDFARAWLQVQELFTACQGSGDVPEARRQAWSIIHSVPVELWDPRQAVRVGIVGEIYVAMEGHANLEIEEKLAAMGIEVVNSQYVSHWLQHNVSFLPWRKSYVEKIIDKAKPYLKLDLGGHDQENIAHMIDFREQGVDGVIHLMPFGCLPELVTQSIIPRISKDLGMPILSLAMDEQRGTANSQTRLEAFIDLAAGRKNRPTGVAATH